MRQEVDGMGGGGAAVGPACVTAERGVKVYNM